MIFVFISINSYLESKTLIDQIFGPKVSDLFPRKYLESASCGDGFYPSTGRASYDHQGVDAEIGINSRVNIKLLTRLPQKLLKAKSNLLF